MTYHLVKRKNILRELKAYDIMSQGIGRIKNWGLIQNGRMSIEIVNIVSKGRLSLLKKSSNLLNISATTHR